MVLKRFWKLITLSIFIIAVLVTYFVHTSIVIANQFPELEIKTISGDESMLENVAIVGDIYQSNNYSSSLNVSLDGSTYYEELSYFEKMEHDFPPNNITKIKDNYRSFMRGKMYEPQSFFENDNYLAYVGVEISDWDVNNLPQYYLEVDVFNKDTEKTHSFQTKLPGMENVQHMYVWDVQMVNEELNVIVDINYLLNDQYVDEVKVYTMDISSEKIVADQTLFDPKEQNNKERWTHLTFLNDHAETNAGKYLLLQKDTNRDGEVIQRDEYTEEVTVELLERTFLAYSFEEKELYELELPKEQHNELLSEDVRIDGFINDSYAYITYLKEENLVVLSFSLEDMKVETKQSYNLKELGIEDYSLKIKDNKIYAVELQEGEQKSAKLLVGDVLTGKVLYAGEIVVKNKKGKEGDFFLHFYTTVFN